MRALAKNLASTRVARNKVVFCHGHCPLRPAAAATATTTATATFRALLLGRMNRKVDDDMTCIMIDIMDTYLIPVALAYLL